MGIRKIVKRWLEYLTEKLYLPCFRFIPLQTFRYGIVGGMNMGLDMFLYFIVFHFVLRKQIVELGFAAISPYIASFLIVFPVTLLTGFWLQRNVTFSDSTLGRGRQLGRYIMVVCMSILINYLGLKLLVETMGLYPTPSKGIVTVITVAVSYFSQKHFTFTHREQKNNQ